MRFARHTVAFLALPGVVAGLVPVWIARGNGASLTLAPDAIGRFGQLAGVMFGAIGLWLFSYSLLHFIRQGRGTLAPWDPPTALVVSGPYRYVRNPMIAGVIFLLVSEALLLRSMPHMVWAVTVFLMNCVYIPLLEEPDLRRRFGEAYADYSKHVRRLVPRVRPWSPGVESASARDG